MNENNTEKIPPCPNCQGGGLCPECGGILIYARDCSDCQGSGLCDRCAGSGEDD